MRVALPVFALLTYALTASAHSLILSVTGANGVTSSGFGVVKSTPRDGKSLQDTTQINLNNKNQPCGKTAKGVNDVPKDLAAAETAGLATAAADGTVKMTLHQVNADGAGPFKCEVSTDATGESFEAMQIVTQVPGNNGKSNASAKSFPLVAKLPAGTSCTGGSSKNACLVRCTQKSGFGGCVAVSTGQGGASVGGQKNNGGSGNAGQKAGSKSANTPVGAMEGIVIKDRAMVKTKRSLLEAVAAKIRQRAPMPEPYALSGVTKQSDDIIKRVSRSRIARGAVLNGALFL